MRLVKPKGINVLSLFDGIACGRIALERAGIPVKNYFASEIEKNSIKIAQKNYPDIQELGDITKLNKKVLDTLPEIDFICGGHLAKTLVK